MYKNFKELFKDIKKIKKEVRLLFGKDLINYKKMWFSQNFSKANLNWCWEYIWDDITYEELLIKIHK